MFEYSQKRLVETETGINPSNNLTISDYARAIEDVCASLGVAFIDGAKATQLNTSNLSSYTTDNLHLSTQGATYVANKIARQLMKV